MPPKRPKQSPDNWESKAEKLDRTSLVLHVLERMALQKLVSESAQSFFARIGKEKVMIFRYKALEGKVTLDEYYDFLLHHIDTPKDVRGVVGGAVRAKYTVGHYVNRLRSAKRTLEKGGGDCDNISLLAKRLLQHLGKKNKHNYRPRIMNLGEHAVCTYVDKDRKKYSIDQSAPVRRYSDIHDASDEFEQYKGKAKYPHEIFLYKDKTNMRVQLDSKSLRDSREAMDVFLHQDYTKDFDPGKILPKNWNKYKRIYFRFNSSVDVFYVKGSLHQITYSNLTSYFYRKGKVYQVQHHNGITEDYHLGTEVVKARQYKKGKLKFESFDKKGRITRREFFNGGVEYYDAKSGNIKRKDFSNGDIAIYEPSSGKLKTKHFPKTHEYKLEVYYPEGKRVKERHFRNKKKSQYKIEWYDETGKIIQVRTWKGKMKKL
jgi:hypothetical protein